MQADHCWINIQCYVVFCYFPIWSWFWDELFYTVGWLYSEKCASVEIYVYICDVNKQFVIYYDNCFSCSRKVFLLKYLFKDKEFRFWSTFDTYITQILSQKYLQPQQEYTPYIYIRIQIEIAHYTKYVAANHLFMEITWELKRSHNLFPASHTCFYMESLNK